LFDIRLYWFYLHPFSFSFQCLSLLSADHCYVSVPLWTINCYQNNLIQQQLPVMCEIYCGIFIFQQNNMSAKWAHTASVSVSPISEFWNGRHTRSFYYSLWLQHPDLNPVNYKICIEIQHRVCLRKKSQRERTAYSTYWYGWHEQRVIMLQTEWCKRHVKGQFQFESRFYIWTF